MHLGPTTQPYPTQAPNIGSYVGKKKGGIRKKLNYFHLLWDQIQ